MAQKYPNWQALQAFQNVMGKNMIILGIGLSSRLKIEKAKLSLLGQELWGKHSQNT